MRPFRKQQKKDMDPYHRDRSCNCVACLLVSKRVDTYNPRCTQNAAAICEKTAAQRYVVKIDLVE